MSYACIVKPIVCNQKVITLIILPNFWEKNMNEIRVTNI